MQVGGKSLAEKKKSNYFILLSKNQTKKFCRLKNGRRTKRNGPWRMAKWQLGRAVPDGSYKLQLSCGNITSTTAAAMIAMRPTEPSKGRPKKKKKMTLALLAIRHQFKYYDNHHDSAGNDYIQGRKVIGHRFTWQAL